MKVNKHALLSATAIMVVLIIPSAALAQHKHIQGGLKSSMSPEMSKAARGDKEGRKM